MAGELTEEHKEIVKVYREQGALTQFLEDMVEYSSEDIYGFLDHQKAALQLMWNYSQLYLLWSRRAGKTFSIGNGILGMGALLSGLNKPINIGLYSGSFSQVKVDFNELISTWNRSPFIKSMTDKPPKIYNGNCEMRFKGHGNVEGVFIDARPLNPQKGGSTSRGFDFQILVLDEFQMIPQSTYSSIFPTASASGNIYMAVEEAKRIKESNVLVEKKTFKPDKNRIILASTAGYVFHPSYSVYSTFKNTADANKLAKDIFQNL